MVITNIPFDYELSNVNIELTEINENNPSRKYHYQGSWTVFISMTNVPPQGGSIIDARLYLDTNAYTSTTSDSLYTTSSQGTPYAPSGTITTNIDIYSSVPYVNITKFDIYTH